MALAVLKTWAVTVTGEPAFTVAGLGVTLKTSAMEGRIVTTAEAVRLTTDADAVTSSVKTVAVWTVWLSVTFTDADAPAASETVSWASWTVTSFGRVPTERFKLSESRPVSVNSSVNV